MKDYSEVFGTIMNEECSFNVGNDIYIYAHIGPFEILSYPRHLMKLADVIQYLEEAQLLLKQQLRLLRMVYLDLRTP